MVLFQISILMQKFQNLMQELQEFQGCHILFMK